MDRAPILQGKRAVVFGAGGSIGAAVSKEFAVEGAEVFLSGRTRSSVEEVAREITGTGGRAHVAVVDALDDVAVNDYIAGVAKQGGAIDIVLNATGPQAKDYGNAKSAVELTIEEFMLPATTVLKSQFITARAATRHMAEQHSGVIIFVTGSPARGHVPGATAIGAAFGAIECLTENLAIEVGPLGIRVVCVRTLANADSRSIQHTTEFVAGRMNITQEQAIAQIADSNFLKRLAGVRDTARAAVLVASDNARMMTGTVVNATAGAALD
ncbi:MAG TPA: SDR family oxidoreductase [Thermomicrobiales bacterium]|nr:SDR family oxidoreductase [Thermomicrobiales bacterium]